MPDKLDAAEGVALRELNLSSRNLLSIEEASWLFWARTSRVQLFRAEGRLKDAQTHVEHTKSHANNTYHLALVRELQASVMRAIDAFEKLAATVDVERCRAAERPGFSKLTKI